MELHSVWVIGRLPLQKDLLLLTEEESGRTPQTIWMWCTRQTGSSRNTSYFYLEVLDPYLSCETDYSDLDVFHGFPQTLLTDTKT
jgi:hypothetical protein